MSRPLEGTRVLAIEQYGAGPFGTQHLADLGCEVIKVENGRLGGDYARSLGPYFADGVDADNASLFFQSVNFNKKSLSLDISTSEGQAILHRLVKRADAVANNLRGDVPERLGLTYEALSPHNRAIVCAHCSAFGRDGPRRDWPGYDFLMQAEAGYFHMSGEPDSPPTRMGLSVVDFMAGTCMALGILAGIVSARATGIGRDVDVNLYDTALYNLSYLATWALNAGYSPRRLPRSAHASLVPCQLYTTSDGWIYVMCNKEKFWPLLCTSVDRPELAGDSRFATFADRLARRDELTGILDEAFKADTVAGWLERLGGIVPVAPVRTPNEALSDPALAETGRIRNLRLADGDGSIKALATPIRTEPLGDDAPAPTLGQDTRRILRDAGYSDDEIDGFAKDKII